MVDALDVPTDGAFVTDRADAAGDFPTDDSAAGEPPSPGSPPDDGPVAGPGPHRYPAVPARPGPAGGAGPVAPRRAAPAGPEPADAGPAGVDARGVGGRSVGAAEPSSNGDPRADPDQAGSAPTDGVPTDSAPTGDGRSGNGRGGRRVIRAGRDLPAAIAVGVVLSAVILVPLFTLYPLWVGVVSAAVAVGTYEVVRALHVAGMNVPLLPLAAGAVAMPVAAYAAGTNGLVLALAGTTLAAITVRALTDQASFRTARDAPASADRRGRPDGRPPGPLPSRLPAPLRDAAAAAFTSAYVGFPAGFATLLTAAPDGRWRTIAFLGTVVASDIGGYTAGVLSGGRHKLAPSVSPGKSWEGFTGSVLACVLVGSVLMAWPLGAHLWQGALLGAAVACTATVGDLGESLLKRDIGIKDMGSLLPGHGGIMDRLDSLLCTAPVAWLLITAFLR